MYRITLVGKKHWENNDGKLVLKVELLKQFPSENNLELFKSIHYNLWCLMLNISR